MRDEGNDLKAEYSQIRVDQTHLSSGVVPFRKLEGIALRIYLGGVYPGTLQA